MCRRKERSVKETTWTAFNIVPLPSSLCTATLQFYFDVLALFVYLPGILLRYHGFLARVAVLGENGFCEYSAICRLKSLSNRIFESGSCLCDGTVPPPIMKCDTFPLTIQVIVITLGLCTSWYKRWRNRQYTLASTEEAQRSATLWRQQFKVDDIPFGARALETGVQVEGIYALGPQTPRRNTLYGSPVTTSSTSPSPSPPRTSRSSQNSRYVSYSPS